MDTGCILCNRELTSKQDYVVLHQYPLISPDTARCHLICFQIRMHQTTNILALTNGNLSTGNTRGTVPLCTDIVCGYCKHPVHAEKEDHVAYQLCQHKYVHLRCASLVDFKRKRGCVLCYSREDERKCTLLWHNNTPQITQNKDTTRAIVRKDIQSKPVSVNRSSAPINPTYIISVIDGGYDVTYVRTMYTRNMLLMAPPRFGSPLRQYMYDKHKLAAGQQETSQSCLLPLLQKYLFGELVTLGLSIKMLVSDAEAAAYFISTMMGASVCGIVDSAWDCSLVTMLLSGVDPRCFLRLLTPNDLAIIDFCMAAMLAAGTTMVDVRKYVYGATTHISSGQYSWFN